MIGARPGVMAATGLGAQPALDELEQSLRGIGIDESHRRDLGEAQLSFKLGNIASWSGSVNAAATNQSANLWIQLGHPLVYERRLVAGSATRGDRHRNSHQRSEGHDLGMWRGLMTAETRSVVDISALRIRPRASVRRDRH